MVVGNTLFEQVFNDGKSAFVSYDTDTGDIKMVDQAPQGDRSIMPRQGEELSLGAIKLSTGTMEYGDTLSLLWDIDRFIEEYLDLSSSFRKFASYYILLSWIYDRFHTLPYLRALGDTGTGKSRFLDTIGGICYKATIVSGCVTPAPIYRMLRRWSGTMILDEADLKNSDEYSEVVTILNCGFEKGRPVIRAQKDNPEKLQFLPTYGPKVFATRRRFKDAALEARCLTEIMTETTRDDIPPTLSRAFFTQQETLRNKLLLFRLRNYNKIEAECPAMELLGVEPRLRQVSSSFTALFAGQPEVLADYRDFIHGHQRDLIEQRASTTVGRVVETLLSLIETDTVDTIDTNDIGVKLLPLSSADVGQVLSMTPQAIGQILKTLGLQTKFTRAVTPPRRCIVYDPIKLASLKKRYILPEDDRAEGPTGIKCINDINGIKVQPEVDSQRDNDQPEDPPWDPADDLPPDDFESCDVDAEINLNQECQTPDPLLMECIVGDLDEGMAVAPMTGAAVDRREAILCMPVARAIEIWRLKGSPVFTSRQGEQLRDLAMLLSNPCCQDRHLNVLRSWLDKFCPQVDLL